MKQRLKITFVALASILLATPAAAGPAESSYRIARELIEDSLKHMQSHMWLDQPAPVLVQASGTYYLGAEHQGHAPDNPTPAPFTETWAFEPASGRAAREFRRLNPDGTTEWVRETFMSGEESLLIDLESKHAVRITGPNVGNSRDRNLRRFPALLLQEALKQPAALRSLGRFGPFDSVQMQTRDGAGLSLFFGRESHALGMVEYLADLPTFADSTVSWKFSDYRHVERVGKLPFSYAVHLQGNPLMELEVTAVSTDAEEVARFFSLPDGLSQLKTRKMQADWAPTTKASVEEVGTGVFRIANLRRDFHMLFVEFDDFVLVIDAPSASPVLTQLPAGNAIAGSSENELSEHAIDLIRETVGDKPIRYLVITHFHSDHAGGLFAFDEPSLTLLAAQAEVDDIEQLLSSEHTLCGATTTVTPFAVEAVNSRRMIADRAQRVEILDVGANPHTDHMLVVWLPRQKILFASDLLTARAGVPDPRYEEINRHFVRWLESQEIEPELILTAHGSGVVDPGSGPYVASQQTLISPKDP